MKKIKQKHQSIKFYFKFSKESIEFLDTVYINSNSRLQTTIYEKTTDSQKYLHAKSAYPFSLKKASRIVKHSELSTYDQPFRNTGNIPKT